MRLAIFTNDGFEINISRGLRSQPSVKLGRWFSTGLGCLIALQRSFYDLRHGAFFTLCKPMSDVARTRASDGELWFGHIDLLDAAGAPDSRNIRLRSACHQDGN